MKINFNFQTRMGLQVATAVAEEIDNNTAYGREFGTHRERETRPVLLSIQGSTYRFEGGIVVNLKLIELSQFNESWCNEPEEWVVAEAKVSYYKLDKSCNRVSDKKQTVYWNHETLSSLREVRPWHHPHVVDIASIKGEVCIFWNNASEDGYVSVDPDCNQEGHYTSSHSVAYSRFVEGDLERAKAEAEAELEKWLTEDGE